MYEITQFEILKSVTAIDDNVQILGFFETRTKHLLENIEIKKKISNHDANLQEPPWPFYFGRLAQIKANAYQKYIDMITTMFPNDNLTKYNGARFVSNESSEAIVKRIKLYAEKIEALINAINQDQKSILLREENKNHISNEVFVESEAASKVVEQIIHMVIPKDALDDFSKKYQDLIDELNEEIEKGKKETINKKAIIDEVPKTKKKCLFFKRKAK